MRRGLRVFRIAPALRASLPPFPMFHLTAMCAHQSPLGACALDSPRLSSAQFHRCGHPPRSTTGTVQIIQLIEGPPPSPPPPRRATSPMSGYDASSSAYCSSEDDESSSSFTTAGADSDSICSSYCSGSFAAPDRMDAPQVVGEPRMDQTYVTTMKRVFAWRETFAKEWEFPPTSGQPITPSLSPCDTD